MMKMMIEKNKSDKRGRQECAACRSVGTMGFRFFENWKGRENRRGCYFRLT